MNITCTKVHKTKETNSTKFKTKHKAESMNKSHKLLHLHYV